MMEMFDLDRSDVKFLPGVGPSKARILADEIGVSTLGDLLQYFPYKHIDRSRLYRIGELTINMPYVQIKGQILSYETEGEGRKRRLIAHFTDGYSVMDLIWFNGIKYITSQYKPMTPYVVFGRPSAFNGRFQIVHPDIDPVEAIHINQMGLHPYYNTTEKMKRAGINSRCIERLVATMLERITFTLPETLPDYIIRQEHLISRNDALRAAHYPSNADVLRKALFRLKFEELFYVQLNILKYSRERSARYLGYPFHTVGAVFNEFYAGHLPFELTGAQKRVIREIRNDMGSGRQMNRLLQGDVGSGKTLVALMSMLIALDNGFQACIMAPTEILAEQHYASFSSMLGLMNVRVELLTGQVKGKSRKTILSDLLNGQVHILVGTHAVLEDTVRFQSLGMVVVDEQHRFGVAQRAKLWCKNERPPHVLVMTATPIPRTLAMTLYGDLDVSIIDELPPGRKPIETLHRYDDRRASIYRGLVSELNKGRQAYVVYPLIKESEKIDIKNAEQGFEQLKHDLPGITIGLVHGKMTAADKDSQMKSFVEGKTQILVATTVIEVGVNVPNASVMVIENAERFGLAQLHQLRGRVGRGAEQSYCILVTKMQMSDDTRKRIQIMTETNDGFEIAEADLKLRGPGDLEGTQQSGVAMSFRIANIARDGQILQYARGVAERVLDDEQSSPKESNKILWEQLNKLRTQNINWGAIS